MYVPPGKIASRELTEENIVACYIRVFGLLVGLRARGAFLGFLSLSSQCAFGSSRLAGLFHGCPGLGFRCSLALAFSACAGSLGFGGAILLLLLFVSPANVTLALALILLPRILCIVRETPLRRVLSIIFVFTLPVFAFAPRCCRCFCMSTTRARES